MTYCQQATSSHIPRALAGVAFVAFAFFAWAFSQVVDHCIEAAFFSGTDFLQTFGTRQTAAFAVWALAAGAVLVACIRFPRRIGHAINDRLRRGSSPATVIMLAGLIAYSMAAWSLGIAVYAGAMTCIRAAQFTPGGGGNEPMDEFIIFNGSLNSVWFVVWTVAAIACWRYTVGVAAIFRRASPETPTCPKCGYPLLTLGGEGSAASGDERGTVTCSECGASFARS